MAVGGDYRATTIQITEDLSADTALYHAIAFNDAKLAANAEEASGILLNSPENTDEATIGIDGEMKFAAGGGSISAGDKLTVANSGWFTTAGSDDGVVGEAKYAVTSGSVGTGIFNFAPGTGGQQNGILFDVTPTDAIGAGFAYALADNKLANNGDEHSGCAPSAISSGVAGQIMVNGIATVQVDPSDCVTIGEKLTVTTSGYYTAGDSGYWIVGMALAAIGSGATGQAYIYGGNVLEST
jgi:hypothetical protein